MLVTTVLTVCDRFDYLESQIEAIESQSINSEIFIHWNCDKEYTLKYPAFVYKNTEKPKSLYNRFYSSLDFRTPYVYIPDDDVLPGSNYLEKCIEFSKSKDDKVLIGGLGMNFPEGAKSYEVKNRVGAGHNHFPTKPIKVDMVGQSYFMSTDLLTHYGKYRPLHKYGEDVLLGYSMYSNDIPIYVLDIERSDLSTYPDTSIGQRGNDKYAQWKHPRHKKLRSFLMQTYTDKGWGFKKNNSLI
jgi:hypothetical protein